MRKTLLAAAFAMILFSCSPSYTITDAGRVTMISHRNIDSKTDYKLLRSYAGGNKDELKYARATSVEDAIEQTVQQVPGGDFLKNAKIYVIQYQKVKYYAVQGDIYGIPQSDSAYNGFKIGDLVFYNKSKDITKPKPIPGKIISIKNANTYLVELDNLQKIEAPASRLYKK